MSKLTAFALLTASWLTWLLAGFAAGGIAVVLERAITLVRASDTFARLRQQLLARPRFLIR
jgi:hypothetical protein